MTLRSRLAAGSLIVGLLAVAGVAQAAPPYKFTVSPRAAPRLPLARVKIKLQGITSTTGIKLNQTTLTVPGATNVPNPNAPNPAHNQDRVIASISGSELTLRIDVNSLVNFDVAASASKICEHEASFSAPVEYTLDLPVASTGHQISSYTAMSGPAAFGGVVPDSACNNPKRRIHNTAAQWTQGPDGTDLGRAPIDVLFVIDESGSMLSPISGTGFASKWALTVQAIQQFVDTLLASEPAVDDRVAMVFYDDTVRKITTPTGDLRWFDKAAFKGADSVYAQIGDPSHPHAGMTTIGGGLDAALNDPSATSARDVMIVMMSDGYQNTSPCVAKNAASQATIEPTGPCPTSVVSTQPPIADKTIPVLGITIGLLPATPGALALQDLTNQTAVGDSAYDPLVSHPSAGSFPYGDTLVKALKGSTLHIGASQTATLSAGVAEGAPLTASIDGTVRRFVVTLGWVPLKQNSRALLLQAKAPGSSDWMTLQEQSTSTIHASAAALNGNPFHITYATDLPATGAGEWQFRALRRNSDGQQGEIPYYLRAYFVEKSFDSFLQLEPGRHATGKPLILDTELSLDGKPLLGVANDISVSVDGPAGAIGTLLRSAKDPGASDAGVAAEPDASAYDKKLANLLQDPNFVAQTGTQSLAPGLTLTELGGGRYRVKLDDTKLPGAYQFHFGLRTNGPSGVIQRIEDVTTQVEAFPSPEATQIAVTALATGTYNLTLTPMDQFGNYIGPGFASRIQITLPPGQGKVASIEEPSVDGTYVVQITGVPPGVDPLTAVSINEISVAKGPLTKLPKRKGEGGRVCGCKKGLTAGDLLPLVVVGLVMQRRRKRRES